MRFLLLLSLVGWFVPAWTAIQADFAGLFQGQDEEITVEMMKTAEGSYECVVTSDGDVLHFTARQQGDLLVGTFAEYGESMEIRMTLRGDTLTMEVEGDSATLTRSGSSPAASAAPAPPANAQSPAPSAPGTSPASRTLRINGVEIEESQIREFEQQYGTRLPRGSFWYDKISGGWGVEGGPTLGFTAPGIDLGGPLRSDASGGNTGVFINNRQLPWPDVQGLQAMGVPVQQGRWWVDSAGNFGVEGRPMTLGNLFQFSRGRGGAYQRATAGGYIGGDGQTSYFFDPGSGASVMIGD